MQRLVYLRTGTSRLFQVVNANHLNSSKSLYEKPNLIFTRCLSSKKNDSKNTNKIDTHPDLYKTSTAKQRIHISDDLKGGQSPETITTKAKAPSTGGGKVWSAQNPDDIHIAPLGRVNATTFVATPSQDGSKPHETTVYTPKGKVNIADPFNTHTLKSPSSPAKLAEEAAASAFKPFEQNASSPSASPSASPSTSTSTGEAVFAPKVASAEVYSSTSSPTANFDTGAPSSPSSQTDTVKYQTLHKGKVYGGQDTTAETKKRPKENPFNLKEEFKPKQGK